jgi:hypothetical protein
MSDLVRLVADLEKAPKEMYLKTGATMKKAAHLVAEDIRDQVKGSATLGQSAGAVSYDSKATVGTLRYEIGFDKMRRAGALGNVWEFGVMSRQGAFGGGKGDMMGALEREMPSVEKHITEAMGDLL